MAHENFVLPENVPANEFLNLEGNNTLGVGERSDSGLGMDAAFRPETSKDVDNFAIEMASEAIEETTPSEEVSEMTTNSIKRKNNVSIIVYSNLSNNTYCEVKQLFREKITSHFSETLICIH